MGVGKTEIRVQAREIRNEALHIAAAFGCADSLKVIKNAINTFID